MVTLRRPPQHERSGPKLEPYQVVLRPLITEKATHLANPRERRDEQRRAIERRAAYTFEVNPLATKTEIKHAIELLFHVKVHEVRTRTAAASPGATGSSWAAPGAGKRQSSPSITNTGSTTSKVTRSHPPAADEPSSRGNPLAA
jgi:large subunit ribosomal protein L23